MEQPTTAQALLAAMDAFHPTLEALVAYLYAHNCDPLADDLEEAFMDAREAVEEEVDDAS